MGYRPVRSLLGLERHGLDLEIGCGCGHRVRIARGEVLALFMRKSWPVHMDMVAQRFRCSRCGARASWAGTVPER